MPESRILLLLTVLLLFSCNHNSAVEPTYFCSDASPLVFADVQSITATKCSIPGCHDGSNPKIPTLVTKTEWSDNAVDSKSQITRGAMPPAGSAQLTKFDTDKILCWINQGAN